jgi:hypothetical protein
MDKAMRHNEGKPKLSYIMTAICALNGAAKVMMYGASKYGYNDWKKGFDKREGLDSVLRHIAAHLNGQTHDAESELPHLDLALAALLIYVDNEKLNRNHDPDEDVTYER